MKRRRPLPERELDARIAATAPGHDVWVAANAGSGKTRILRNRVIRLMLEGTPPDRILCLTYTRAAAAEMQGRIFEELARWVTLEDRALDEAIGEIVSVRPKAHVAGEKTRAAARRLFARAVETPGGLKVQTIHAFAERVLHLFPVEAGVPLDFSILTDEEAEDLRAAARRETLEAAVAEPASVLGQAFGELRESASHFTFSAVLGEMLQLLSRLALEDRPIPAPGTRRRLYQRALGVADNETLARIEAAFLEAVDADLLELAAATVARLAGSDTQRALGEALEGALKALRRDPPDVESVLRPFVTGAGEVKKVAFFTKSVTDREPVLKDFDADLRAALGTFLARRAAHQTLTRSLALLTFAEAVAARFEAAKQARGLLDFNDLIRALGRLLQGGQAGWVLFKLDGGIDHILIDEAQDTTRPMWEIVSALTAEFFAGQGARPLIRSLFVVGDEKQSIYSFQGADPLVFEEYRTRFAALSPRGALIERPVALTYSFRSSDDVLGAVDDAFRLPENREGLSAAGSEIRHLSADENFPGLVELWPPARPTQKGETPRGPALAARALAETIAGWLATPERHLVDGRPVRPGDILVLVRERNAFYQAVRKELKARGVPLAGADRLTLQQEIVVQDLLALCRALLTPDDDLSLAGVLRSPMCGLAETALEQLARGRAGSLRAALMASPAADLRAFGQWLEARAGEAAVLSPFTFLARLLAGPAPFQPALSLRAVLAGALGSEINDPLNALLNEALTFEQDNAGALLPFVLAQAGRETQLKRDAEGAQNKVRVMTVHGAKGLEARIVFLADAHGRPQSGKNDRVITLADAGNMVLPVWSGLGASEEPPPLQQERATRRAALMREYRRLLYVGMTRAAERLYIVSHHKEPARESEIKAGEEMPDPAEPLEASWYQLLRRALPRALPVGDWAPLVEGLPPRGVRRMASGLPPAPPCDEPLPQSAPAALPAWLRQPLPPERRRERLNPSAGGEGPALTPRSAQPLARRRGVVLHSLFELLARVAPAARAATAQRLLAALAPELAPPDRPAFAAPVLAALASPHGQRHFGPESRAEVAISGAVTLSDGTRSLVSGRIDRLTVTAQTVRVLDLKTGQPRDAAQDGAILRQMALYRALLSALYPGRAVECEILWLETLHWQTLPDAALDAAFAAIDPTVALT